MHSNTKMKSIVLPFALILAFNVSFAQKNASHFKSEIDFGNGTAFSTFLDVTIAKDQFTITSPKNADVRIFGGKAKLGRMSAASPFVVSGKYMLILPIADFYTYDGVRLDRVGVNPDIEVKSE